MCTHMHGIKKAQAIMVGSPTASPMTTPRGDRKQQLLQVSLLYIYTPQTINLWSTVPALALVD